MTDERRRDDRLPVLWKGVLYDEDDQAFPCEVRDVSHAGALVTASQSFTEGTHLLLVIDGLGDFASSVRWLGKNSLGLMLLAGDDLALKRFAAQAGENVSKKPAPWQDLVDHA